MEPRFGDHDSYAESGRSFKGNQEEVLPRASACSSPTIQCPQDFGVSFFFIFLFFSF